MPAAPRTVTPPVVTPNALVALFLSCQMNPPPVRVAPVVKAKSAAAAPAALFEVHEYPNSRTGFDNPNVPGAYNAEYAADAWERTFAFLKKHLGS